jgi:hypothetical protein
MLETVRRELVRLRARATAVTPIPDAPLSDPAASLYELS